MIMEAHSMTVLFQQLGLDSSEAAIDDFIQTHHLPDHIALDEATFWSSHQSLFLKEMIEEDADWALVVDNLSSLLRH